MNSAEDYFTEHYNSLLKFAIKKTGNETVAEDIVQESFCAALRKNIFEKHTNPSAWLYQAVWYEISHYFREKHHSCLPDDYDVPFHDTSYDDVATELFLKSALSETDYNIICMYVIKGMPEPVIAEKIGISPNAARIRIHRIKKKLSSLLDTKKGIS